MADIGQVETVRQRPGLTEVIGVLVACAVLFVGIIKLDHAQARHAEARARKALAAQANRAPAEHRVHPPAVTARTLLVQPHSSASRRRPDDIVLIMLAAFALLLVLSGIVVLRR